MHKGLLMVSALALLGCDEISTADSDDVKTSGIDVVFEVSTEGNEYLVTATLSIGDGDESTYLLTNGGDELSATFNGDTRTLRHHEFWHQTTFPMASGELEIHFEREEFISAMGSVISLAGPGSLTAEFDDYDYQTDDEIRLFFDASGAQSDRHLSWEVSCGSGSEQVTRSGSQSQNLDSSPVTIPLSTVFARGPQLLDYPAGCDVQFTLSNETTGVVSGEFNSGRFRGSVDSDVSVTVTP